LVGALGAMGAAGADVGDALRGFRCSWVDDDVDLVLVRSAVQTWVECHGHKSAHFLVYTHLAVHVEVGMVRGMLEELEVASGLLPQLALRLELPAMYVPELELVVAWFGLQFLCPILSAGGIALGVTETLFCEPRAATVMALVEH
jgi:hypothetical protein